MPVIIDGGRIPPRWAESLKSRPAPIDHTQSSRAQVHVAFINNMPDAALEDTEMQFFELLEAAAGDLLVSVRLHSLSGVPRAERGQRHIDGFYSSTEDLLNGRVDAVIMTGTEPRQRDLRQEPYWQALADVLDWAESDTISTVLSCLAAHAGVLHSDGIERCPLPDKQFGVFELTRAADHPLTAGVEQGLRFPHSRWNEVREESLTACGYTVLTKSEAAGVDSFVKKKKRSLFLHFQGHPEYFAQTLFKEYRRDIRRFLNRERETYPTMPHGYFNAANARLLGEFQAKVIASPREELMSEFPEAALLAGLQKTWHSAATVIYHNWLHSVVSQKTEASTFPAMAAVYDRNSPKRSATR
jgi:homoserine O-succinyltransferase/O-acetyltransferase